MKRVLTALCALTAIFCLLCVSSGTAKPIKSDNSSYGNIMPLSEIRPGMKGYGKTVFHGIKPERFGFEVLGFSTVWAGASDMPIIVCRAFGGSKDYPIAHTGVVAGMSGSPMYINGRLIGAWAYGGIVDKDPIFGVTPIEEMVNASSAVLNNRPAASSGFSAEIKYALNQVPLVLSVPAINNLPEDLNTFFSNTFRDNGFMMAPSATGEGKGYFYGDEGRPVKIEPGSAINAYLVDGDIKIMTTGTVTVVDKQKNFLAFGHPFLKTGPSAIDVAPARILTTLANYYSSYKYSGGDVGTERGMITVDCYSCIAGQMDRTAPMLPITIDLFGEAKHRTINCRIAYINGVTAGLVQYVSAFAISDGYYEVGGLGNEVFTGNVKITTEIVVDGMDPIFIVNSLNFKGNPFRKIVSGYIRGPLTDCLASLSSEAITINKVKSIRIGVTFRSKQDNFVIKRAELDRDEASPGDTVRVYLAGGTDNDSTKYGYRLVVPFVVPKDAVDEAEITICNGVDLPGLTEDKQKVATVIIDYLNTQSNIKLFMHLAYCLPPPPAATDSLVADLLGNDIADNTWVPVPQENTAKRKPLVVVKRIILPAGILNYNLPVETAGLSHLILKIKAKQPAVDILSPVKPKRHKFLGIF